MIVLNDIELQASFGKIALMVVLDKKATLIAEVFNLDDAHITQRRWDDKCLHGGVLGQNWGGAFKAEGRSMVFFRRPRGLPGSTGAHAEYWAARETAAGAAGVALISRKVGW